MTAIWNNFSNGVDNLERYADVMANLGAHTASSSGEIAKGLEKFASVAGTIGLSFDYAATAMATVTAQTRQSADSVGTSLKTLFSRLESLNLGKTLEDGVSLNKYSESLMKVGVNVLEANGQLKDMDSILEELGNKWNNLTQAQQVALA
jgi:TP901 family phage tail tape measure protein